MNQIKAGVVLNYVIIGLNTLTGLLYTPYLLHCLGQNEYGLYSLVASIIAYLTLLDFGFGNAIVRYTAKYRAEGKTTEQWEMFGMFLIVYSIIGFFALLGGLALYFNVDALFDKTMTAEDLSQARVMMILLTINLALTFPFSIFGSIITAYENFVFQRVVSIVRIILTTGVMITLLSIGFKAIALVVVQTVFNILILLLNFFYCKYRLDIKIVFKHFNMPFLKEIATYSFWIFLNAIMDKIYWGTGQFILGSIVGTIAVAIFSVAITLQQMYMTFSTSIAGVLLPRITSMVSRHTSEKEISDLFIRTGRMQCIVMTLIMSGFIVFGQSFIDLWAGKDYAQSYIITLIFLGALYIPLMQNTGVTILQARNQMKFRSLLYIVIAAVSLIFQIVLAKRFGAIGCAIAIGGALLLGQGLVMNIYYQKVQKIDIINFWKQILHMIALPILITICGVIVIPCFSIDNSFKLLIGIVGFAAIYIPLFWKFSMNNYEHNLLLSSLNKLIHRQ